MIDFTNSYQFHQPPAQNYEYIMTAYFITCNKSHARVAELIMFSWLILNIQHNILMFKYQMYNTVWFKGKCKLIKLLSGKCSHWFIYFVFCDNMNLFMVTLEPSPFLCVAAISTSKEMSVRHQNGHYPWCIRSFRTLHQTT